MRWSLTVAVMLSIMHGVPAAAQDAAEAAVILSGTGASQARAQKSLGSHVSSSIGNAASILATPRARGRPARAPMRRSGHRVGNFTLPLPADVDPLEKTDAPVYELANGSSIRVSGGLRRRASPADQAAVTVP